MPTGGVVSLTSDDEQSFEDLFRTHHQAIYRYCLRRLEASDAEDAAAEVFAVAWRRRGAIPEGDASRVWLFGVAFRVVGNRYRSSRRRARLTARVQGSMRSSVQFDDVSDGELLLAALSRLNASDREILKLSNWDDLDRRAIAAVLGISENATDQRLHRARSRLRVELGRVSGGPKETRPKEAST